jgi:hypothetical protein
VGVAVVAALWLSAASAPGASTATFGKTTIGASNDAPSAGYKFGTVYALSEPARTVAFSWYSRGGSTDQRFVPVVYATDAAGNPAGLVAQGAETTVRAGQAAGWVTSPLPAVDLQPGTYLLGLHAGPTSKGAVNYFDATPNTNYWNANAYPTPSPTWGQLNVSAAAWSAYVTYTPNQPPSVPPESTSAPAIAGTPQQGTTLQASTGAWNNSPTGYAYQWQRCGTDGASCAPLAGTTAATYAPAGADVGSTLRVTVTATNAAGSSAATSDATAVVQAAPPTAVFGKTTIGASTNSPGSGAKFGTIYNLAAGGATVSFSWYARGGSADQKLVPVVYATDGSGNPSSLVAQGAELTIRAGQSAGWVTSALPSVTLAPGNYLLGMLSGTTSQGAVDYYDPTPNTNYWNLNTYPTPSAAWGQINVSAAAWSAYVTYIPAQAVDPPQPLSPPTVSGNTVEGQVLTATSGSWSNAPSSYAYRWRRCDSAGAACADIAGAAASSYTQVSADVGHALRVTVAAANAGGSGASTSDATAPVAAAPVRPTRTFGRTTVGSFTDSPGTGAKFGNVVTLSETGTVVSFSWFVRGGGSYGQAFVPIVYATDANGNPAALVVQGASVTVAPGRAPGWVTMPLPNVVLQPGRYLIGVLSGDTAKGAVHYFDPIPSTNYWNFNPSSAPSSSWGQINVSAAAWSMYVSYVPSQNVSDAPQAQTTPAIAGTPQRGASLTADIGTWSNDPVTYAEQWQQCDAQGASCVDLPGAIATRYTVTTADVGHALRIVVTARNSIGASTATSSATAAASDATASPPQVYIGYVDNATGLNPWSGSPSTTFVGTGRLCCLTHGPDSGRAGWDTGVVRVTNAGDTAITVNSVTVGVGAFFFDIWARNYTVAPGATLLVVQNSGFNFDTSDLLGDVCGDPAAIRGVVTLTVDGVQRSYVDADQVLNTGGVDRGACTTGSVVETRDWDRLD